MARALRRQMRIFRRDALDLPLAGGGTAGTEVAPSYGFDEIRVFGRLPAGGGTLEVFQFLRANSTPVATNTIVLGAPGFMDASFPRTGELVAVSFTNGGVAQAPELLVTLA